jgi:hypothetical protein
VEGNQPLSIINQLYLRFCPRVTSFVSVLDSGGIPVKNITADRLTCREDNQPVECTIVPAPADHNVSMTIILGLNGLSLEDDVRLLKSAARSLVNSLNPGDRIAVMHLEDQARPTLQFTSDTQRALDVIDTLQPVGPGNALYDAVLTTAGSYRSAAEDGNRHIVVLFTALDKLSGSIPDFPQAIGTARSSGATFYTVAVGPGTNDVALTGFLRQLSRETFGQFFSEPSSLQYARLAGRLTQLIQGQYAITTNSLFVDFRQKPLSFTFQIPEGTVTATRTYIPCNP